MQNALIARLTDSEGKLESLQRIYLKDDNTKDTRKQTAKFTGRSNEQAVLDFCLSDLQASNCSQDEGSKSGCGDIRSPIR